MPKRSAWICLHWALEPGARPQEPAAKCPGGDDAHGHGGVVERLIGDRVCRGEAEDDADKDYPQHAYDGDGFGKHAQAEGPAPEIGRVQ